MPVNSTHADYDRMAGAWERARDVLSGEDAVKAAGVKYLPKLDIQEDDDYDAYKARASFFNATARTLAGYVGMIFRRPPFLVLGQSVEGEHRTSNVELRTSKPEPGGPLERRTSNQENGESGGGISTGKGKSGVARAMEEFSNDADMLGTSLYGYAKAVVAEVIGVGRCGTLIDWQGRNESGEGEDRAYAAMYKAEQILNWRVGRINGRNVPTMVVVSEQVEKEVAPGEDEFEVETVEQVRVLKLIELPTSNIEHRTLNKEFQCLVEVWREVEVEKGKKEWRVVETKVPKRLGRPLPWIPFVFHGPEHSRPAVARLPLEDIIAENLGHYRMDADYKHGLHYTALPTAWVSGFDKSSVLKIGSSVAWVAESPGATAGFLEYMGHGLGSFERALDHAERLMAVLGSRLLEGQKKIAETAEAMQIRQSGEDSILSSIATSISESMTQVLRWVYWWNSTEERPEDVTDNQALVDLNTDFRTKGLSSQELAALVSAWQAGAISQDTMFELFRKAELIPDGRTNEEEAGMVKSSTSNVQRPTSNVQRAR